MLSRVGKYKKHQYKNKHAAIMLLLLIIEKI